MIERWDIITIGNLSRNRYWGERDDRAFRPALCTSTLVRGLGLRLLIDAPLADAEAMESELNRRTGLRIADVTDVFLTHSHGDHVTGLSVFAHARWWAGSAVAESLNTNGGLAQAVQPVREGQVAPGIEVIPTPGHTADHHSLRFECDGACVVVAGDAAMTRDFWRDRQGFHNSVDFEQVARTMDELEAIADIIVPGHDNYFIVGQS